MEEDDGSYRPEDLMCKLCLATPWTSLPPEEYPAYLHYESRAALEESAKSCVVCQFILRAATSHLKESNGSRKGKGYWRNMFNVNYIEAGETRRVMYVEELGANLHPISSQPTASAVAPTGKISSTGNHESLPHDPADVLRMESLSLTASNDSMKVWLYGNWWKQSELYPTNDTRDLYLLGIGARFAATGSIHDAPGSSRDTINLRGSAIRVCSSDGMK